MPTPPSNDQNTASNVANHQGGDPPNTAARANLKKTSGSGRANKQPTRQILQDKNTELNNAVEILTAQLQQAQQALADAEKAKQDAEKAKADAEARAHTSGQPELVPGMMIPKPSDRELNRKGEANRLQKAMGLDADRSEYICIQATVRDLCPRVGIDYSLHMAQQSTTTLAKLFKIARKRHPLLARFQNDWATAQLVKQFLQNKRKQANQKRKEFESGEGNSRKRGRFDTGEEDDSSEELGGGDQNGDGRGINQDGVDDE